VTLVLANQHIKTNSEGIGFTVYVCLTMEYKIRLFLCIFLGVWSSPCSVLLKSTVNLQHLGISQVGRSVQVGRRMPRERFENLQRLRGQNHWPASVLILKIASSVNFRDYFMGKLAPNVAVSGSSKNSHFSRVTEEDFSIQRGPFTSSDRIVSNSAFHPDYEDSLQGPPYAQA
jgi:hypothetical protein